MIKILHSFLINNAHAKHFFELWKSDFVNIHGFLDSQRKVDVTVLYKKYDIQDYHKTDIFPLIFCLETYYTIVLRLLSFNAVFKAEKITKVIFNANFFKQKGIENYNCKTYFNWFLEIKNIEDDLTIVWTKTEKLINHEVDFIKAIFEDVFPAPIRHAMGEFYTPDWLANFLIKTITTEDKNAHTKTYLDPTCGSGTFIFNVIKKFQQASNNQIFQQVFGIDLNPVSVLAAKTNYLILYSRCFDFCKTKKLQIPIYYADAIQAKFEKNVMFLEAPSEYDAIEIPKVDYVVGNPPWVNWEYLPNDYKQKTVYLWEYYNLFGSKGFEKSFVKEDISILVTYVALDKYLKNNGKLGFVVKETLFKSIKQGAGFRKFKLYPSNTPINPYRVDDLTAFKPFKGVANRTAIVFIEKNKILNYPVDYIFWQPLGRKKSFDNSLKLKNLLKNFELLPQKAFPADSKQTTSGWISTDAAHVEKINLVLGKSMYKARTGTFTGGANGIFWLNILEKKEALLLVENMNKRAKNKMKKVKQEVEKDWIFPFLTGNDLDFWEYKYSKYTVCPHTAETKMYPIDTKTLAKYPKTKQYFETFETELKARKGFTSFDKHILQATYYAIQRVGSYTFAPYKVAWRYICKSFCPAVIEYTDDKFVGYKNILPNEKIIFVGLEHKQEAYYLCGLLSSTIYRKTIESYMVGTQITPSIIQRLNLPKFDKTNALHLKISNLCEKGHFTDHKEQFILEIDELVDEILYKLKHTKTLSLL